MKCTGSFLDIKMYSFPTSKNVAVRVQENFSQFGIVYAELLVVVLFLGSLHDKKLFFLLLVSLIMYWGEYD